MRKFKATAISAKEHHDVDAFAVVLAEAHDGSGHRLEIQRALVFDEQDAELGQDTYCLSTEQGATFYGGVAAWSLVENELRIVLDAEASKGLGVRGFVIEVEADPETCRSVELAMKRALDERI